ncbi:probable salivary secreted peptide [Periplaneta americana]|uniref:probable salivary secreted peptide n=1 Tax=Periplaneta americana TaxID=6978 RepID=UPI0037E8E998
MLGKAVCVALLLSALLLGGAADDDDKHNFSDCRSQRGDRKLLEKTVTRTYKLLGYTSSNMAYSNPDARINCIEVIDLKNDGHGGYASIESGGVGHSNVTIHFESQFSRGFSFTVKIYGQ